MAVLIISSIKIVYRRPDLIQPDLLDTFMNLWDCKALEFWTKPIEETEDAIDDPDSIPVICPIKSRHLFSNIISNCLMHKLVNSSQKSFEALEILLVVLIEKNFLTASSLNEQFVTILREEWPEVIFKILSFSQFRN